jgi:hypothetical protein
MMTSFGQRLLASVGRGNFSTSFLSPGSTINRCFASLPDNPGKMHVMIPMSVNITMRAAGLTEQSQARVPEDHAENRNLLLAVYVVFGAAGGIGSALVQRLSGQQGAKVIQVRN